MHAQVHTDTDVRMDTHARARPHTHARTHARTRAHTHARTHTHTHTHTHARVRAHTKRTPANNKTTLCMDSDLISCCRNCFQMIAQMFSDLRDRQITKTLSKTTGRYVTLKPRTPTVAASFNESLLSLIDTMSRSVRNNKNNNNNNVHLSCAHQRLSAHMIDINLNTIFYTYVEHLPKQFT